MGVALKRVAGLIRALLPAVAMAALLATGCHRRATHAAEAQAPPPRAAVPAKPAAPPPRGKQITIVYSSNLLGEYEPCG